MSIFLYFHCIAWLSFAGTIVKVTPKKGKATNLKATITVKNPTISAPATAEVTVGATASVAATAKPAGAVVSYASDNTAVATVDANGVVTGVAEGTAKITATVKSGSVKKTATTTVTVVDTAAKKIASVTATSVKTLDVKFDGIVKDAATGTFKVSRAGTDVTMTAKWAADNKSAVLTSEASLQAGTYTVAYGEMTGTVVVTAQKATKISILTTKVGLDASLGSQQRVYYKVLDQYGNDMGVASNKLTVTATNMNKNSTVEIDTNSNKTNTYFDMFVPAVPYSSIGDKIAVVAYLTTDVSVNVSANIEIANIYTKTFAFGEPDKAKDAHFYVEKTDYSYSLPYTATDSEGNKVLLEKTKTTLEAKNATTNNLTFISSNPSTIDPKNFKIDSNGKLTFTTGNYASTVTLTALNTVTGETTNISITVGKKPALSKVEVTDVTVRKGFSSSDKVKAEIVGYDQYGTVIPAANMANLNLANDFTFTGSAWVDHVSGATVTKDGKYVEFTRLNSVLGSAAIGAKFDVRFISKTDVTLSSTATLIIGDARVASYFKVDSSAVDTLFAGASGDLKVTVYDNYDQEMNTDYSLSVEETGRVTVTTPSAISGTKQVKAPVTADRSISGASESGTVEVVLYDAEKNEVDRKTVTINVSNVLDKLIVSTDKDTYASGDKINVEIKAYNGQYFLNNFNATVATTVVSYNSGNTAVDTKKENLTFKNGVATTTLDAKTAVKSVGVAVDAATATGNTAVDEEYVRNITVNAPSATTKYGVAVTGSSITVTAQNAVGETVTGYAGNKAITVKVEKKTALGTSDVTDEYIASNVKNSIKSFANGTITIGSTKAFAAETDVIYIITVSEQGSKITGSAEIKK